MQVSFTVNGTAHSADLPEDMPLLWVLRDVLGLTGTKYGCGIAQCGACTVHIGGMAVRSCQIPASELEGAEITTIEGLASQGPGAPTLHPVQEAWIAEQVAQCGYCQGGQIMQAVAFLEVTPQPSDAQIDAAMSANLCRCGTYPRIRAAIKRAAAMTRG